MKTHITRHQERSLYRIIEMIKQAHNCEGITTASWNVIEDSIASQLAIAFPKVDSWDLYCEIYSWLEKNNWESFASDIIEQCKNTWLFDCERRGLREWLFISYMTWDETGREKFMGVIEKIVGKFRRREE